MSVWESKAIKYLYQEQYEKALEAFKNDSKRSSFWINFIKCYYATTVSDKKENPNSIRKDGIDALKKEAKKYTNHLPNDLEYTFIRGIYNFYKELNKYADRNEAEKCFLLCSEKNIAIANHYLGLIHSYAYKDYGKEETLLTIQYYLKAIEGGYLTAYNNLSNIYMWGYGTSIDKEKGNYYLDEGTKYNERYCLVNKGINLLNDPYVIDKTEAFELIKKSAKKGHVRAYRYLGRCYYNGYGVNQDKDKGIQYLKKAIKYGHHQACFDLINIYESENNVKEANKYKEELFNSLNSKLDDEINRLFYIEQLSRCYLLGYGTNKNPKAAIKILTDEINRDFNAGLVESIGNIYLNKELNTYSLGNAIKAYSTASEKGSSSASNKLGDIYNSDQYDCKNEVIAEYWYKKAVAQNKNNVDALYSLGLIKLNKGEYDEAYDLLNRAKERNKQNIELTVELAKSKTNNDIEFKRFKPLSIDSVETLIKDELGPYYNYMDSEALVAVKTGLFIYSELEKKERAGNELDFAPVVTLLSKGLEITLRNIFVYGFTSYLKNKGIPPKMFLDKNRKRCFIYLADKSKTQYVDKEHCKNFTLASFQHLYEKEDVDPWIVNGDKYYYCDSLSNKHYKFLESFIDYCHDKFKDDAFNKDTYNHDLIHYLTMLGEYTSMISSSIRNEVVHLKTATVKEANFIYELLFTKKHILRDLLSKVKE